MSGFASSAVEAREVEPVRHLHGGGEPALAGAGEPHPEIGAVPRHRGDDARAGDPAHRVHDRLAHRHRHVEEELVVAADEFEHFTQQDVVAGGGRASAGASARSSRPVQATLRWCISSPMERPRATSAFSGTPSLARRASPSSGARVDASQRSRSRTASSLPPKRMTLPSPSFTVQKARFPNARFSTTITGIVRVVSPVIGPTVSKWWFGANRISPEAASASAAPRVGAQPSSTIAPATAPRIGPHIRAHSMGGPAWRIIRSSSPSTTSPAGRTSTSTGSAASIRSTATALAASTRSVNRGSAPVARSSASSTRASALAGGVQATSTTGTPPARRSSANRGRPTFTTRGPCDSRSAAVNARHRDVGSWRAKDMRSGAPGETGTRFRQGRPPLSITFPPAQSINRGSRPWNPSPAEPGARGILPLDRGSGTTVRRNLSAWTPRIHALRGYPLYRHAGWRGAHMETGKPDHALLQHRRPRQTRRSLLHPASRALRPGGSAGARADEEVLRAARAAPDRQDLRPAGTARPAQRAGLRLRVHHRRGGTHGARRHGGDHAGGALRGGFGRAVGVGRRLPGQALVRHSRRVRSEQGVSRSPETLVGGIAEAAGAAHRRDRHPPGRPPALDAPATAGRLSHAPGGLSAVRGAVRTARRARLPHPLHQQPLQHRGEVAAAR